jgi:hypothetical protein
MFSWPQQYLEVSYQIHAPAALPPVTHWIGGRSGLNYVKKRKYFTIPGLELRFIGRRAHSRLLSRLPLKTGFIRKLSGCTPLTKNSPGNAYEERRLFNEERSFLLRASEQWNEAAGVSGTAGVYGSGAPRCVGRASRQSISTQPDAYSLAFARASIRNEDWVGVCPSSFPEYHTTEPLGEWISNEFWERDKMT